MRVAAIREPGGPEVLTIVERPDPRPGANEVLVRVRFAGVNRADLLQRAGHYPAPPGVPADVPGLEYAGEVEAVGDAVTSLRVGERVVGLVGGGAYAERVVVHEREVARAPEGLDLERLGALPEAFVTAYDALVHRARVQASDWVLVHAAGSGVGTAAVQLAKALGARVVGTSRTPHKLELAKALGLDAGVVPLLEEGKPRFADAVREATRGRGADVVIDLVGGAYLPESVAAAAPRARVVLVGLTAGGRAELDLRALLQKRLVLEGTVLRSRPLEEKIAVAHDLEQRILPLVESGALRPVLDRTYPLAEAAAAHERVARGEPFGKVLLAV
jgi:NADPH2:quinone reductase